MKDLSHCEWSARSRRTIHRRQASNSLRLYILAQQAREGKFHDDGDLVSGHRADEMLWRFPLLAARRNGNLQ